jgi:hypothetical protein
MLLARSVWAGESHRAGCESWSNRLEFALGDAQVCECVLPVDVRLEVDEKPCAPPQHLGVRHSHLCAALSSAPVEHVEQKGLVTKVKEHLRLDSNVLSPRVRQVSMPPPHPIVPVVDGAPDRHPGLKLDVRIAERDHRLYVARVVRRYCAAMELDVLLRHVLRLARGPVRRMAAGPPALAVAWRDMQQQGTGRRGDSRTAFRYSAIGSSVSSETPNSSRTERGPGEGLFRSLSVKRRSVTAAQRTDR